MQLQKANGRSQMLYEELVASALRKTDFLEQSDLNLTPARAGVSNLFSQSSAEILLQQLKERASFQKKW